MRDREEREMASETAQNYWIIVGSPENYERTRALGYTQQGMKSRHRKKAERMRPGDKIAYYITGKKAFGGVSTITSEYFESHDRIWASGDPNKADEDYPFRVTTEPEVVLPVDEAVDAEPVARKMRYVSKWPAANWTLAFQGNVHLVDREDFELIRDAVSAKS
jgi:hypothetical protein